MKKVKIIFIFMLCFSFFAGYEAAIAKRLTCKGDLAVLYANLYSCMKKQKFLTSPTICITKGRESMTTWDTSKPCEPSGKNGFCAIHCK